MAMQNRSKDLNGLLEAAIEVATSRRYTLQRLRSALESGDSVAALSLARELCGLENEKASTPIAANVD
jgi:hypothetical protein